MAQKRTLILKVDTDPYQDPDDLEQDPVEQEPEEEVPLTQLCNYEEMLVMGYEDTCGEALRSLINGDGPSLGFIDHGLILTWETIKGQEQQWVTWERQQFLKHDRLEKCHAKPKPKFIPNPGDPVHLALRHYKDKHNMREAKRKRRKHGLA